MHKTVDFPGLTFILTAVFHDNLQFFLLQVKERPDVGVYIKDLSGYVVNNADDMDRIMTLGHKNRKHNNCLYKEGNEYQLAMTRVSTSR